VNKVLKYHNFAGRGTLMSCAKNNTKIIKLNKTLKLKTTTATD